MHVLHLLEFSPPFGGTLVNQLRVLGRAMKEEGNRLTLAFPCRRPWFEELADSATVLEVPPIRHPVRLRLHGWCERFCRREAVDLVHIQFSFALAAALSLSLRRWPFPIVYHWHNPPKALLRAPHSAVGPGTAHERRARFSSMIARAVDRRSIARHLTVSREILDLLVLHGWTVPEKITCIPNGVVIPPPPEGSGLSGIGRASRDSRALGNHTRGEERTAAAPERDKEEFIIGCVANFRPQKDHATLLTAFSILLQSRPDSRLLLVGDGPCRGACESLVARLGVVDKVEFTGFLPDLEGAYRRMDLFALATHYEGQPAVVLEAMARELPVVATDLPSIRDSVNDGVEGFLVPALDPPALAEALRRLAGDPALRSELGRAARARVAREFSVEEWARKVRGIDRQVLAA